MTYGWPHWARQRSERGAPDDSAAHIIETNRVIAVPPHLPPIRIVEERYARGEISAAELERMRSDLQAAP